MVNEDAVNVVSDIIGWCYFLAWSASFYPQSFINYKKKNVGGFSLEFALLNPSGFFFYSVYSVAGRVNSGLGTGDITNQDLVFALHAFALSSVQLSQIFIYDRGQQGDISKFWIIFLIANYVTVLVVWGIEVFNGPLPNSADTFLMMGYCKAAITFVKYLPQVYLNWSRKSCEGFSWENVVLDFMGGSLSFLQSAVKSIALGEPFFDAGAFNLVKFILSITSIFFDSIFFI
eukprot:CAMPEP_0185609892 /NCGR_PEP_ID=MMETSP0436-20130131/11106_1 /TAXON_ID=626734 ORGANISM="Favella taraikaensis, Strain Fe Narragansett Bay" /NCGR_SAMPLE_ID=MMETSP0436 /ASSEMBLY_ACC=CAM_ASM_000390 /LENGTH=230 /DNA_ID=CAMNT_0028242389 /DNA_START=8 /DNA_END=700 /DNA_ORIENTATION=+